MKTIFFSLRQYGGSGSGLRVSFEEIPNDLSGVDVAAGAANEEFEQILLAARPGMTAAFDGIKRDFGVLAFIALL